MLQAHKLHDNIHDIELSTLDARTVGEVKKTFAVTFLINMTKMKYQSGLRMHRLVAFSYLIMFFDKRDDGK